MDITDEELRKQLANYMDNVPPVTGSTREVLKLKLAKYTSSETSSKSSSTNTEKDTEKRASKRQTIASLASSTSSPKTSNAVENAVSTSPVEQASDKRRKTISVLPRSASPEESQDDFLHNSPSSVRSPELSHSPVQTPRASFSQSPLNKSRNGESILYEDGNYRVRYFPSSEMPEYPGGVPVFRRRSLHPLNNKEDTSNPYEEFYIRSPRLQAKIDAERIISRVMSGDGTPRPTMSYRSAKYGGNWLPSSDRKSLLKMPSAHSIMNIISGAFLGFCALLLAPFAFVRCASSRFRSVIGCRTLLVLCLVCILVALAIFFIFSDPFYRNPVAEFADRLSGPLASFLQTEN
nr:Lamino associated polypeptide 2 emerin [Hymenolepis microstoma]